MREVFLNYWNWFADLANPYHDVIIAISTVIIAAFTVVLALVAWRQTRDVRILQRAYLNVKFGGIQSNSADGRPCHVTKCWTSASTKIVLASQAQQGRQRLAATKD
jgi:hypothetical protein